MQRTNFRRTLRVIAVAVTAFLGSSVMASPSYGVWQACPETLTSEMDYSNCDGLYDLHINSVAPRSTFTGATFSFANFSGSDLFRANFTSALIVGTDFNTTELGNSNF